MQLRSNLQERAVVRPSDHAWTPSPIPGIERMMLERDGDEVARATSLVRYAAGSRFEPHAHGGGEEIFVLEGEFCDEHGRYGAGSYLRNPPGSSHAPYSDSGCLLFVKLRQFSAGDTQRSAINTAQSNWYPGLVPGLQVMPLHEAGTEHVALVQWAPGTVFKPHMHYGGEEILVLRGVFEDEHGTYPAGSWLRSPHLSRHSPFSKQGCVIYVKTGHLLSEIGI